MYVIHFFINKIVWSSSVFEMKIMVRFKLEKNSEIMVKYLIEQ